MIKDLRQVHKGVADLECTQREDHGEETRGRKRQNDAKLPPGSDLPGFALFSLSLDTTFDGRWGKSRGTLDGGENAIVLV